MSCNCFAEVDKGIASSNARCASGMRIVGNTLKVIRLVQLEKIDDKKRKSLPSVVMSFCPFCGKKMDIGE